MEPKGMDAIVDMYGKMSLALERLEGCREFAELIPEVRTNLVYVKPDAQTKQDVLGIDGRITIVNGKPHASGRVKFGASSHMARLVIEVRKIDPLVRAGINFISTPNLVQWLRRYCEEKQWQFSVIDRSNEPDDIKVQEEASMPWKVREAVRSAGNRVPKIFYETGAVGKEPVTVLLGRDPVEVVEQVCEIARLYHAKR